MTTERGLRAVAILIALLAVIDPAWTRRASVRPAVVVLSASPSTSDLSAQILTTLTPMFDVSTNAAPGAAAYVIAGRDLPDGWIPPDGAVVMAVTPTPSTQRVAIERMAAPADVLFDSVATLQLDLTVPGTGTRDVTLSLHVDGVHRQDVVRRVEAAESQVTVPVTFVPSRLGVARVRVDAVMPSGQIASVETAIGVTSRVWRVLVFDGRPTYASTFVRRALEADSRFDVVARSLTSRGVSTTVGTAPPTLTDASALSSFDLVIVGAPEVLGTPEAAALERYLRERHGAVVLLPESGDGDLLPRLTGVSPWRDERRAENSRVTAGAHSWNASEFVWPASWPPLVTPMASMGDERTAVAPVWQMPVGAGRLVVSSAIDGWRSRADVTAGYAAFWRLTAATVAAATPTPIHVQMDERLLQPGAPAGVVVWQWAADTLTALVEDVNGVATPVRLWPSESGGPSRGVFRAPEVAGRYRVRVTSRRGDSGVIEFVVDESARLRATSDGNGLASAAATAHGGATIAADAIATLPERLTRVLPITTTTEQWHVMRSVWWIIPFALCATGEWWLRRRRGLR